MIIYMSTILYQVTSVLKQLRLFIFLNPITFLTETFHNVILYGKDPGTGNTIYLTVVTAASLV